MKNSQAKTTYLKHYKPPAFFIERTDLVFDLYEDKTIVTSELLFSKNKNLDENLIDLLSSISAKAADACIGFYEGFGSGHFVKMVHNGIEYAEMQLIA